MDLLSLYKSNFSIYMFKVNKNFSEVFEVRPHNASKIGIISSEESAKMRYLSLHFLTKNLPSFDTNNLFAVFSVNKSLS